jgi:hypothetical protein
MFWESFRVSLFAGTRQSEVYPKRNLLRTPRLPFVDALDPRRQSVARLAVDDALREVTPHTPVLAGGVSRIARLIWPARKARAWRRGTAPGAISMEKGSP